MLCFVVLIRFLIESNYQGMIIMLNIFSNVLIWFRVTIYLFISHNIFFSVRSCNISALIHFHCQTGGIFTSQQDYIDWIWTDCWVCFPLHLFTVYFPFKNDFIEKYFQVTIGYGCSCKNKEMLLLYSFLFSPVGSSIVQKYCPKPRYVYLNLFQGSK